MYVMRWFAVQTRSMRRSGFSAKKLTPRSGRIRTSLGTPEIRASIAPGIPLAIDNSRTVSRYSAMP